MHVALALGRGQHWLLTDEEAKQYGTALANALRHMPVQMAQKWVDYTTLGIAIVSYEGPRLAVDMQRRRQARNPQARPPQQQNVVFPFPMPATAPVGPASPVGSTDVPPVVN